jgi:hypothetical protein
MNVVGGDFEWKSRAQGIGRILGDALEKSLGEAFVVDEGEFLDNALLVKLDDQIASHPGTIPATRCGIIAANRPGDAPGRFGPPPDEEVIIFDAGVDPAEFLHDLFAWCNAGDNEIEVYCLACVAGRADTFGGHTDRHDDAAGTKKGNKRKQKEEANPKPKELSH